MFFFPYHRLFWIFLDKFVVNADPNKSYLYRLANLISQLDTSRAEV